MSLFSLLLASSAALAPPPQTGAALIPAPQDAPRVDETGDDEPAEDVVVTGQRERGAVPGDIAPEIQLRAGDIRTYGASTVSELLTALEPQTTSGRGREGGRPVVLLNGRRISGFGEIRDLPTEAIERVDILPEEAALRLGYRADQRVVNFVLRRRFNAITGELQGGGATEGGRYTAAADGNLIRLAREKRLTLNLHYDGATPLYENDRDIVPADPTRLRSIAGIVTPAAGNAVIDPALPVGAANAPSSVVGRPAIAAFTLPPMASDVGAFRTLASAARTASANATYSRTIAGNVSAALNGSFASTATHGELGLASGDLILPATNPYSPFSQPVTLSRYLIEGGARRRDVETNTTHVGLALNGDFGDWRWSSTSNFDRAYSRTVTDRDFDLTALNSRIAEGDQAVLPFNLFPTSLLGDMRRDTARSVTSTVNSEVVASGPVLRVPAGRIAATIKAGFENSDFDARATRLGTVSTADLRRGTGSVQGSVDVPIASRRTGFLDAIGNVSLNGNYALDRLSDFGTLITYGYGANWSPIDPVRFIASVTEEEGPPSVAQLGNPVVDTPDVRLFDFVTGQSVDVTQVDGGNRALLADNRRVTKLGLTLRPLSRGELTLSANYTSARTLNPISSLPAPTAEIEAAFPDRFVRDADGTLLRFDNRPVNFARRDTEELRWGINFSKRLGAPPPRPEGGFRRFRQQRAQQEPQRPIDVTGTAGTANESAPAGASPPSAAPTAAESQTAQPAAERPRGERGGFGGGRGGGFGGGRGGFGGGGFGGTRVQFSAYHTWRFEDRILIRPGVPVIDLLDGGALGNRGGQSAHQVDVDAGLTKDWLGLRASARWQSASFVRGGTLGSPTDLNFAPLTTITLRAFANMTPNLKIVRDRPWLRGVRFSLSVQNLFDAKPRVTDASGAVPLNYQPDLLDPTGRTIRFGIRKLFF